MARPGRTQNPIDRMDQMLEKALYVLAMRRVEHLCEFKVGVRGHGINAPARSNGVARPNIVGVPVPVSTRFPKPLVAGNEHCSSSYPLISPEDTHARSCHWTLWLHRYCFDTHAARGRSQSDWTRQRSVFPLHLSRGRQDLRGTDDPQGC